MKMNGAQIIVRALDEEGVTHGFGIPGTHNIELYDVMSDAKNFHPVLVTDEQAASFMADGFTRSSRNIAVVNVVPGAGLTHALSGIAEAFMDNVPMLVLACGIRRDTGTAFQLHDIDQVSLARPVCKKTFQPRTHVELYHAVREACHLARLAPAGPVLVEVSANLYLFTHDMEDGDFSFHFSDVLPKTDVTQIEKMARLVNESENVAIYAGRGAEAAGRVLTDLADYIDAIVYTTISGKGVFPEDHPRFAWNVMGKACPKPIRELEKDVDCLIAVGCRFGEVATGSYGNNPPDNLIHIDVDSSVFNRNYPAKLTLQADADEALKALLVSPVLQKKTPHTSKLVQLANAHSEVRREQAMLGKNPDKVSPDRLIKTLQKTFGPDAIFIADSGNGTFLAMEHLRLTKPNSFLAPVDYSCMGYSVPATIGAKLACPTRPVIGLIGDGAFLMTGMELLTAVNYSVPCAFVILRDGELSQIAQFQRTTLNRETCTALFKLDFGSVAQAVGMDYIELRNDQEVDGVLDKMASILSRGRPVLVNVGIDYSKATYFSGGVIKTNFLRLPWKDRFRFAGRVVKRKLF